MTSKLIGFPKFHLAKSGKTNSITCKYSLAVLILMNVYTRAFHAQALEVRTIFYNVISNTTRWTCFLCFNSTQIKKINRNQWKIQTSLC